MCVCDSLRGRLRGVCVCIPILRRASWVDIETSMHIYKQICIYISTHKYACLHRYIFISIRISHRRYFFVDEYLKNMCTCILSVCALSVYTLKHHNTLQHTVTYRNTRIRLCYRLVCIRVCVCVCVYVCVCVCVCTCALHYCRCTTRPRKGGEIYSTRGMEGTYSHWRFQSRTKWGLLTVKTLAAISRYDDADVSGEGESVHLLEKSTRSA